MPPDIKSELDAILTGAAIFPLDDRAFLRITGSDATRWLNGMVTNSIQALAPGEGNYNFLLNAQGRIQGDCIIYRDADPELTAFVLETDTSQIDAIQQHLDKFIIMDDVEMARALHIHDPIPSPRGIGIVGTRAAELLLRSVRDKSEQPLKTAPLPGTMTVGSANSFPLITLAPPHVSAPYYELWCTSPFEVDLLRVALVKQGAVQLSDETQEAYRILSGSARFGVDIRDKDLPQETNQTHALHFSKGCYLGQEIVERIRSRGQVHRTFSGFRLTAMPASLPASVTSDGKSAGELTSAAILPLSEGDIPFALGYVRREALDRNQPLAYEGGTATPAALPFRVTTS